MQRLKLCALKNIHYSEKLMEQTIHLGITRKMGKLKQLKIFDFLCNEVPNS